MTNPAQMAIIRRKAPVILPSTTLETGTDDDGLTVTVLRFAMGPEEQDKPLICYWTVARSDSELQDDEEPEIQSFNADSMSKDEAAKQVVLLAMERLIENGVRDFNIYIDQEPLRRHIENIQDIFPELRILKHSNRAGISHNLRVREHLNNVVIPLFSERDKRVHEEKENDRLASLSTQRSVYVDASLATGGADVGFGCVIKDIITDTETGEQYWNLTYDAAMTIIANNDGSTGAELQAILETLKMPELLNKDIREGRRSLTFLSDSRWGIELLNALRHGTEPKIDEKIKANWWIRAERIVKKLDEIENVEFKWVKGHGTDLLNDAADRLALSQRRNEQADIPLETREVIKKNIILDTLESLSAKGIKAVAHDLKDDPS